MDVNLVKYSGLKHTVISSQNLRKSIVCSNRHYCLDRLLKCIYRRKRINCFSFICWLEERENKTGIMQVKWVPLSFKVAKFPDMFYNLWQVTHAACFNYARICYCSPQGFIFVMHTLLHCSNNGMLVYCYCVCFALFSGFKRWCWWSWTSWSEGREGICIWICLHK